MVRDTELRKGNMVLFSPSGQKKKVKDRIVIIQELHEKTCITLDLGLTLELFYKSVSMQPIPLTPEILEKCGFIEAPFVRLNNLKRWQLKATYHNNDIGGEFEEDRMFDIDLNGNVWYRESCGISGSFKYLHQLQNLIFSLTGTELITNPSNEIK